MPMSQPPRRGEGGRLGERGPGGLPGVGPGGAERWAESWGGRWGHWLSTGSWGWLSTRGAPDSEQREQRWPWASEDLALSLADPV